MSAFREAVAEWNKRFKDSGWRSGPIDIPCPACKQDGHVTASTIAGVTSAFCSICSHAWKVAA